MGIRNLELWSARHLGSTARAESYRAWFDHFAAACAQHGQRTAVGAPADSLRANYVAVVGEAAARELKARWGLESGYVPAARFAPPMPDRQPPTEFVGVPVTILRRVGGS